MRFKFSAGSIQWMTSFFALSLTSMAISSGCLQKQDALSTDALTAVDSFTPEASSSDDASRTSGRGATGGEASTPGAGSGEATGGDGEAPGEHIERPPGFGSKPETGSGSGAEPVAGSPEPHEHVERPPGFGGKEGTGSGSGAEAPVGTPEPHEHVERPPGFGSKEGTGSSSGAEAPIGAPEQHEHVERPPGFGSKLPPEGRPELVPAPAGGGKPVPVQGEPEKVRPEQKTPFEQAFQGKKMVVVSGEVIVSGKLDAPVDLDCFVPDAATRAGRKLVNKVKLDGPGPYQMKVPANFGKLIITGFMDLKGDGPDSHDPQGAYDANPLEVKDKNISKVNISLKSAAGATK